MKVLASLKPYYYYLIGEKIKTLEIRKSDLKNLPQDVLFYMSKDEKSFEKIPKEFQKKYRKHFGKIGMRVVCDEVEEFYEWELSPQGKFADFERERLENFLTAACLSEKEIVRYWGNSPYFKPLYGWHISKLKIYDKPKELSELWGRKNCLAADTVECWNCFAACREINGRHYQPLSRPPQSWCYIEETALSTNK